VAVGLYFRGRAAPPTSVSRFFDKVEQVVRQPDCHCPILELHIKPHIFARAVLSFKELHVVDLALADLLGVVLEGNSVVVHIDVPADVHLAILEKGDFGHGVTSLATVG
jgi:hypothetical protein